MKIIKILNFENVSEEEVVAYKAREASRAIVFDKDNLVALLHVTKHNYYKLPGGGIDKGEDKIVALKRECLEEIGCHIEVEGEVGIIIEYKKQQKLKQISYCYKARVVGDKGGPHLEAGEIADGFQPVWLSLEDAKKSINSSSRNAVYPAQYMVERDLSFVRAV